LILDVALLIDGEESLDSSEQMLWQKRNDDEITIKRRIVCFSIPNSFNRWID